MVIEDSRPRHRAERHARDGIDSGRTLIHMQTKIATGMNQQTMHATTETLGLVSDAPNMQNVREIEFALLPMVELELAQGHMAVLEVIPLQQEVLERTTTAEIQATHSQVYGVTLMMVQLQVGSFAMSRHLQSLINTLPVSTTRSSLQHKLVPLKP